MVLRLLLVLAAGLSLSGCSDIETEVAAPIPYVERGRELARKLQQRLGGELKQALQAGGPAGAVGVCQSIALPLTREVSDSPKGPRIRRTALRIRNPANRPDRGSISVMKNWQSRLSAGETLPEAHVRQTNDSVIVHLPIRTGQLCLKCHGDPSRFTQELNQKLAKYYPEDEATGFELGDLRGAFRIDYPK